MVDTPLTSSSVDLKKQIMATSRRTSGWKSAGPTRPSSLQPAMCPPPPQLLQPLFLFLKEIKAGVINFGNGTGKLLAFHLLQLLPFAPSVRIATTTDPHYDWCGIDGVHITDVVVIIRGKWQVVGEVQGNDTTGMMQLVAALHTVAAHWGVAMW